MEDVEGKPQAHILLMRALKDMLVHTQTHAKAETHIVWGVFPALSCSLLLYRLPQFDLVL